jgi:hypothetical protein
MPGYSGNPFRAHRRVHDRQPFTAAYFHRWLALFEDTLVHGWQGPHADRALAVARQVAAIHSKQLLGSPVGDPAGDADQVKVLITARRTIASDTPTTTTTARNVG